MTDEKDKKAPNPDWLPHTRLRTRWDRALTVGDAVFRWHSRLDGSAVLYGPAGRLSIGDTVAMPVGYMHGSAPVAPVPYVVAELHETENGHVWIKVVRERGRG